jgi:ATP-dependent exoDNAse (exonuclease V) beta subunit
LVSLGTGKSRTIAGSVLQLRQKLYEGNKLLICAPSNGARDELMRRILDEFKHQEQSFDDGKSKKVLL